MKANLVKTYSDVPGDKANALRRSLRLAQTTIGLGVLFLVVGIVFHIGVWSALIFVIAAVLLLVGGAIALFDIGGVALEVGAIQQHTVQRQWPYGSSRLFGGRLLGRGIGCLFVLIGAAAGIVGLSILLGWLTPPG